MDDPMVARIRFAPGELSEALRSAADWVDEHSPHVVNMIFARPDASSEQIVILYHPAAPDRSAVDWAPPEPSLVARAEVNV